MVFAGLPILIVVPWVIGRIYVDDTLCWTTMDNYWVYLIIAIPTSASILVFPKKKLLNLKTVLIFDF